MANTKILLDIATLVCVQFIEALQVICLLRKYVDRVTTTKLWLNSIVYLGNQWVGKFKLAFEPDDREESSNRDVLEQINLVDLLDQSVNLD